MEFVLHLQTFAGHNSSKEYEVELYSYRLWWMPKQNVKCLNLPNVSIDYLETKILLQFYSLEVTILKMSSRKWKVLILKWAWGREGQKTSERSEKGLDTHIYIFSAWLQCSWKWETNSNGLDQTWCGQSRWNSAHVILLMYLSAGLQYSSWFQSWISLEQRLPTISQCAKLRGGFQIRAYRAKERFIWRNESGVEMLL